MEDKFNEMFTPILQLGWFSSRSELEDALTNAGFEVLERYEKAVVIGYEDEDEDALVQINLGGTSTTIVIDSYEEIDRLLVTIVIDRYEEINRL